MIFKVHSSAVSKISSGEFRGKILPCLKNPISPMRNCMVLFAFALGLFVRKSTVGRVYSPMRSKKKKAINERSPMARSLGVPVSFAEAYMYFGTDTGIASCGIAGESFRRSPSTIRATGRRYVSCALWIGLRCPASWQDVEMAPSASVTLPTLTVFPLPK